MNFAGLNLITLARQRIKAVFGAFAASAACCLCGALMTFVFAPGQALQAWRISRLPVMDAAAVAAAAPGDTLLVTGVLVDNEPALEGMELVGYRVDEWEVTATTSEDGVTTTHGTWQARELIVPALKLDVGGQTVTLSVIDEPIQLGGDLTVIYVDGPGPESAEDFGGRALLDGTLRYQGPVDGDTATVLGKKAENGGIYPDDLFVGSRAAFEQSERDAASSLLFGGLCAMALAPVVLVGGVLAALFGRRR